MDTQKLIERVALDERFQAACQRYAHGNGSSHAIAATAVRASAAPELLDACMAMIEWDDRERDHAVDFNARMDMCRAAFDKARAAISKATC